MSKKIAWAFIPICLLLALGVLNIHHKIVWREPADGVTWEERGGKIQAVKVEPGSIADLHGIKKGDLLYSIDYSDRRNPIRTKIDVLKNQWAAWATGQRVSYQISREGEMALPSFNLTPKGPDLIYFYLALIGLTTFVIGLIVFFNSKKTLTMPYIYFYMLSLALYCYYTFSPTGELDFTDSVFYWLDKASFLYFPPLLLHFFIIFPQRKKFVKNQPSLILYLYIPAAMMFLAKVLIHLPLFQGIDDADMLTIVGGMEKLDLGHFALFTLITLFSIFHSSIRPPSLLIKKQLKLIVYGLGFGTVPFTVFYVVPFLLGLTPSRFGELTVLLQALIPLTFAYSISRYKLMDFEILLKKAATLVFSYFVIACFYVVVSSQTRVFSENRFNIVLLGILAMILGATLFTPLKKLFQTLLDRVFYKRSYAYRRTLLTISKELSRERNLQNLSQSLLDLITNALSLRSIALILPSEEDERIFYVAGARGGPEAPPSKIAFDPSFLRDLKSREVLSYYASTESREPQPQNWNPHSTLGFFHFLPLRVEDKLIGCLAMGKKLDGTFLTSEDWELLTTISSPVALAIENAALYNQASIRALELERLKDYSENIIESLNVGVVVLDQAEGIIGWNRIMEERFGLKKSDVLGKALVDVIGPGNFSAVFPADAQQNESLMSELRISLPRGEERIFEVARTPLLDNRMTPYGTIIVFEDITEKIRLQQQLVTSEKLASIGLLSAGVAHEINTPLTGISSYVQMLQKKLADSQYSQILGKIEVQTDRVARIIKNLLSFARNPSDLSFHRVNLKESLEEIISLIDYKLKAMNIQMEMALPQVKPIWAQGERLQQVFINIILNAIDAMPNGGRLRIELRQTAEEAEIRISDTGHGIKKQHLPLIFDPFFTTKGMGKGTGLGLSISYAIIKEHEGHMAVESETGKGTTFTITLPADLDSRKMNAKSMPTGT